MRAHPGTFDTQVGSIGALLRELRLPETCLSPLLAHAAAVSGETERLGLVSADDALNVLGRHTADSLLFALAREPEPGERWADVGSGAGFPGLPLACCYPETTFTLIEPQRKRAGFLELQIARLGVTNAEVRQARAAAVAGGFDVATARALAEPSLALEALLRLVEPSGTALLAVGMTAAAPHGAADLDVSRPFVDSPGRFLMISHDPGPA